MADNIVDLTDFNITSDIKYKFWRDLDDICVFDVETTGLDWNDDDFRIIQFTAGIYNIEEDREVAFLNEYINPDMKIPKDSMKVHGIYHSDYNTQEEIDKHGKVDVSDKRMFKHKSKKICSFMQKPSLWCAFNHTFDTNAFASELKRHGYDIIFKPTIDPLIFERKRKGKLKGTKLWDTAKDYGVATVSKVNEGDGALHDARTDVELLKTF